MRPITFRYPVLIKEQHLDTFAHVNNATYFILFEEARWDLMVKNGFTIKKIQETKIGPTILRITVNFLKELRLRDEIMIETKMLSYERKIGILQQRILRQDEVCCEAEFTIALFNLNERKIIEPTADWLKTVGME